MTRWHGADEAPAAAAPVVAPAAGRRTVSRQTRVLIVAAVLLLVAAVLVVVVVAGGGSDGPAAGSPEAVTDQVATAVAAHSRNRLARVTCPAARTRVLRQARRLLRTATSAERAGSASVTGEAAVVRLMVGTQSGATATVPVTVALRPVGATWCLDGLGVPELDG